MSFLTTPLTYTRDQRTSRDVCREACSIELPLPRKFNAHRIIVPACMAAMVALTLVLVLERFV